MRIASRSGFDNVLMAFDKGTGQASALFNEFFRQVASFRPGLVIIETAADVFGGNENARLDVKQFVVNCCERIAREVGCAVVICAHPSVAGMVAGHGYSGSTAWNASVRSRLYLRRDFDKDGHEQNPDLRILELKKANFSRQGSSIDLIWRDGVFEVNDPVKQRAGTSEIDKKVIAEIGRAFDEGTAWSAHPQARFRYIGTWLRDQLKQKQRAADATIGRLLSGGSIVEVEVDAHTHKKGLATGEQAARARKK
jgi:RecA-family ATPase